LSSGSLGALESDNNNSADSDYLLYPSSYGDKQHELEFYRPSLASSGCCQIL
jgi:hypothetical protein